MTTQTLDSQKYSVLKDIEKDLRDIKDQLAKFMLLVPEERLREYKDSVKIKKAYLKALKSFSPK